jgi:hypothetical protein
VEKARAVLEIAAQVPEVLIIPMPDYRPKYPKIDPEEVINPNHPNLTIWGNKIEACIFVGVHCHYANLTLKMIRAGTNCCTSAICAEQGHEDAMLTIRDADTAKLKRVAQVFKRVRLTPILWSSYRMWTEWPVPPYSAIDPSRCRAKHNGRNLTIVKR